MMDSDCDRGTDKRTVLFAGESCWSPITSFSEANYEYRAFGPSANLDLTLQDHREHQIQFQFHFNKKLEPVSQLEEGDFIFKLVALDMRTEL